MWKSCDVVWYCVVNGQVSCGVVWCGVVWQSVVYCGEVWCGKSMVRCDVVWGGCHLNDTS